MAAVDVVAALGTPQADHLQELLVPLLQDVGTMLFFAMGVLAYRRYLNGQRDQLREKRAAAKCAEVSGASLPAMPAERIYRPTLRPRQPATPPADPPVQAPTAAASPGGPFAGQRYAGGVATLSRVTAVSEEHSQVLEKQMLQFLQQREFTRALNLFRSLERDIRDHSFSEELYSAFVRSAVRVGKADVTERMLRSMKRQGLVPSVSFWQTALRMLSSRKYFSACLSLHSVFVRDIPTDKVVYSCLINAALEIGDPERAAALLDRYSTVVEAPEDYHVFFRTYVALKDVESAEATFRKMGASAQPSMLNLLLLICVNIRQPERALKWLREAHRIEAPEARIVDVVSYNTVIRGFESRPEHVLRLAREMVAVGIEPDDITFGALLDSCASDPQAAASHEFAELLTRRPKDTPTCTAFIKSLVRCNRIDEALDLFRGMKASGEAAPDMVTYTVLIKAMVDRQDLDRALALVEEMKEAGHQPDNVVVTHLLEGCRHVCNLQLGKRLFTELLERGMQPSEFTLAMMLKLYGRCGAQSEAHELLAGWPKACSLQPSVIHYTCLMSGCMRTRNYELAWGAYELMRSKHIEPDGMALSTLLPGMLAAQQWERVVELAKVATNTGKSIVPPEMLNSALSQIQAARRNDLAEQLRELMAFAGVATTSRGCRRAWQGLQ